MVGRINDHRPGGPSSRFTLTPNTDAEIASAFSVTKGVEGEQIILMALGLIPAVFEQDALAG